MFQKRFLITIFHHCFHSVCFFKTALICLFCCELVDCVGRMQAPAELRQWLCHRCIKAESSCTGPTLKKRPWRQQIKEPVAKEPFYWNDFTLWDTATRYSRCGQKLYSRFFFLFQSVKSFRYKRFIQTAALNILKLFSQYRK